MELNELLEEKVLYNFYGVDNNLFKLGRIVFEAIEDEDDGYRSYLGSIPMLNGERDIFPKLPIANVYFFEGDDFHYLTDETGHCWLRIGTDDAEDYYPCFIFDYQPREGVTAYADVIDNLSLDDLDPWHLHCEKLI